MTSTLGMLEWVENTQPLKAIIEANVEPELIK
jgi:hypothetical protein